MQESVVDTFRSTLSDLNELDRDYLEATRRRLLLMNDSERSAFLENYKTKAALYYELYRTAERMKPVASY